MSEVNLMGFFPLKKNDWMPQDEGKRKEEFVFDDDVKKNVSVQGRSLGRG